MLCANIRDHLWAIPTIITFIYNAVLLPVLWDRRYYHLFAACAIITAHHVLYIFQWRFFIMRISGHVSPYDMTQSGPWRASEYGRLLNFALFIMAVAASRSLPLIWIILCSANVVAILADLFYVVLVGTVYDYLYAQKFAQDYIKIAV